MAGKTEIYIKSVFGIFIISFLSLIVYVSMLGDNHKIDFAVEQYFESLKKKDYEKYCGLLDLTLIDQARDCSDLNFVVESALLERYGLSGSDEYSVLIRKSHFRIPFFTDDSVMISISLAPKKRSFFQSILDVAPPPFISDFMVVKKEGKLWKIKGLYLNDRNFQDVLRRVQVDYPLNRYITVAGEGFTINRTDIRPDTFNPAERRLFEYSMKRLSDL